PQQQETPQQQQQTTPQQTTKNENINEFINSIVDFPTSTPGDDDDLGDASAWTDWLGQSFDEPKNDNNIKKKEAVSPQKQHQQIQHEIIPMIEEETNDTQIPFRANEIIISKPHTRKKISIFDQNDVLLTLNPNHSSLFAYPKVYQRLNTNQKEIFHTI